MTNTTILRVFVTNLGKYNEGELVGEWLDLPASDEEISELLERIGIDGEEYEEFFITDYESDLGITCGEYDDLDDLNDIAENVENLDEWERDIVEALLENYDLEDALDMVDDVMVFCDCDNMADVAEQYCDETGLLDSIPENLRYYFDFEAFGRDMSFDGEFIFHNGNCYEVTR